MKDKEVNKWFGGSLNLKEEKKFIKKTNKSKEKMLFGIELPETKKIIGIVSLIDMDYKNKQAGLLSWLGNKYWRKGFSFEAKRIVLNYAFNKLKLHRLHAEVDERNTASMKLLEKVGFKKEGIKRDAIFKNGKYYDETIFGLLKKDFKK